MENNEQSQETIIDIGPKVEKKMDGQKQIAGAIIVAGFLIAGAILFKGNVPTNIPITNQGNGIAVESTELAPVTKEDRMLGNKNAPVTIIEYADFQCPFCGKFFKEVIQPLENGYIKDGKVNFVYRDYAFLGEESSRSSEAAWCAGDQGKFWEYHDYLFNHQNGENQGAFSDPNLKSFAKTVGLNEGSFNNCFDGGKYAQVVKDSMSTGVKAGVRGTPKGFILRDGKLIATIDGAEPQATVMSKIEKALK